MRKFNNKGFTLIELLAVILIMGILMVVAIPSVSRIIENSRRDTFMDTAKAYMNAIKNSVAADEIQCEAGTEGTSTNSTTIYKVMSATDAGYYYYSFTTATGNTATDLMEQGGKSSWGNADVAGQVYIKKTVGSNGRTKYEYGVVLVDQVGRGIGAFDEGTTPTPKKLVPEAHLVRTNVNTNNAEGRSKFFEAIKGNTSAAPPTKSVTYWGESTAAVGDDFHSCQLIG